MTKDINKIGIMVKLSNPEAVKTCAAAAEWLLEKGKSVFVEDKIASDVECAEALSGKELAGSVDAILVLGGDGTLLHTVRLLSGREIPILGVNQGGLGFLTAVTVSEMYPLLEKLIRGDFKIEERMLLSVKIIRDGETVISDSVLNDVVIKGTSARLVKLETQINKEYVTTYRADGLIVATPTGSTAYSLSAAGPILHPTIHSIIVAPICPFNLTNRPVVIPDWMTVAVTTHGDTEFVLTLDGQVDLPVKSGDTLEIVRSKENVSLVCYEGKSYFDILRERLLWEPSEDRAVR